MKFAKGQPVKARDYQGKLFNRLVWEDTGKTVFITSPEVFTLLEAGSDDLWPIGFPRRDVSLNPAPPN